MSDPLTPAQLVGDLVVAQVVISVHRTGAVSISGNVGDTAWALALLDHAKDAIKNQARPRSEIVIPGQHTDFSTTSP